MMAWVANALLLCIVGMALGESYHANVGSAHENTGRLHSGGFIAFAQSFHYWGSALLIVHATLQLVAMFLFGVYGRAHRWGGFASVTMLATALGFQITGNLLPFDRHGVQTAAIENGIMNRAPLLGHQLAGAVFSGSGVSAATLPQWYALHRLLPFAVLLVAWMCWLWRAQGKRYLHWPTFVPTAIAGILSAVVASPLGSAATASDFTSFDARVSWYTLPFHASMTMWDSMIRGQGWIGAIGVPTAFAVAFVASGFVSTKSKWPRWTMVGALAYFSVALLGWGGAFAPLTGTRDPKSSEDVPAPRAKVDPIDQALARRGNSAFNDNCASCHGQNGRNGEGGPSLANVDKSHSDADFFLRYVRDPRSVKSSSTMPGFPDLKQDELRAIAEYLRGPH